MLTYNLFCNFLLNILFKIANRLLSLNAGFN